MQTVLLLFLTHYSVCCKFRSERNWTVCEYVGYDRIVWC
jgi:hypothetical protein